MKHICKRMMSVTLDNLNFTNVTLKSVPIDSESRNFVRTVRGAIFSRVEPTPIINPKVVITSEDALSLLGISDVTTEIARADFAELMCGNKILFGSSPHAHCYAGHQFGHFSGQLGDGATMYLGEVDWKSAEEEKEQQKEHQHWELQFKGAGLTPYSRTADGRKVLRSSLREFLCSEAHYYLGIPTTRSASVVTSDTAVIRDIFYTGNPKEEQATVITRIAQTFLRFGSFEIFKSTDSITGRAGPSTGQIELLRRLLNFMCRHYYSNLYSPKNSTTASSDTVETPELYLAVFDEICKRTARMVASWQVLGWCHGVLNTDNMSIVGVTLDYGPFGWMETFDRDFICNASDNEGRYSYANQPRMCQWNCSKLGEAISPCLDGLDWRPSVQNFALEFSRHSLEGFRARLGLSDSSDMTLFSSKDEDLIESLLATLHDSKADFNNSFRVLMKVDIDIKDIIGISSSSSSSSSSLSSSSLSSTSTKEEDVINLLLTQCSTARQAADAFKPRIPKDRLEMFKMLAQSRPDIASQLDMINEELAKHDRYEKLSRQSDSEKKIIDSGLWHSWILKFKERLTAEACHIYSKTGEEGLQAWRSKRQHVLKRSNPKYILRNWIAQVAITAAEDGDFSIAKKVYDRLKDPYGLLDLETSEDDFFSKELAKSLYATRLVSTTETSAVNFKDTGIESSVETDPVHNVFVKPPTWSTSLRVT